MEEEAYNPLNVGFSLFNDIANTFQHKDLIYFCKRVDEGEDNNNPFLVRDNTKEENVVKEKKKNVQWAFPDTVISCTCNFKIPLCNTDHYAFIIVATGFFLEDVFQAELKKLLDGEKSVFKLRNEPRDGLEKCNEGITCSNIRMNPQLIRKIYQSGGSDSLDICSIPKIYSLLECATYDIMERKFDIKIGPIMDLIRRFVAKMMYAINFQLNDSILCYRHKLKQIQLVMDITKPVLEKWEKKTCLCEFLTEMYYANEKFDHFPGLGSKCDGAMCL